MDFISEELQQYIDKHSMEESNLLKALDRETHQKVLLPRMLSGSYQGRLLSLLSKMVTPKKILEVGTYTGYATLCLAEGLAKGGSIDTIDHNEELVNMQRRYFDQSPYSNQIVQHLGDAKDILKTLSLKNLLRDLLFNENAAPIPATKKIMGILQIFKDCEANIKGQ